MEILDLLEELEHALMDAKRPFYMSAKSAVVNREELMDLVSAIRKMIDDKYELLKARINEEPGTSPKLKRKINTIRNEEDETVSKARHQAQEIQYEIDEYADQVLQNLKLTVTKFRRKLIKLDSVIDLSRERMRRTAVYHDVVDEEDSDHDTKT